MPGRRFLEGPGARGCGPQGIAHCTSTLRADLGLVLTTAENPCYDRVFRADIDTVRGVLLEVETALTPAIGPEVMGRTELVLAELLNNISEHGLRPGVRAGSAVIRLRLLAYEGGVACLLADTGAEVPQMCLSQPLPPIPASLPEGGFGWPLIHDLTRQLCYIRDGPRNFLIFRIPA